MFRICLPGVRSYTLAVASLLIFAGGATQPMIAEAQNWREIRSSRQLWDEQQLDVRVEYAAGRLEVRPTEEKLLYQLDMRYDEEHFTPVIRYDREEGALRLGVRGEREEFDLSDGNHASLALTPTVPLDLRLRFGAGEADIDLGGLSLRDVDIATGASETRISFDQPNRIPAERVAVSAGAAELELTGLGNARAEHFEFRGGIGETTLDFSGAWDRNAIASIKVGVGSLILRLPRELGVKMVRNSFLTSTDAPGMTKRDGAYYSRNWESASHRLTLNIDAALGSIQVKWID